MLIDDITIKVRAGHGGRGAVAFQRVKQSLGPTGSSGGRGGSVYLEGVSDIGALRHFRAVKEFRAENGENGKAQFNDGRGGEDLVLHVPVGTVAHIIEAQTTREITKVGERLLVAQGGRGGKGNYLFRSSRNTSPEEFQPGLPGETFQVRLELKLIADVGIIGLPNAGKSTLINALTRAQSKVANYAFTTLEPHLGAYYSLLLADIPGLIEGASEGKGLGTKFLRHVERTKLLFHLVSAESDDVLRDYDVVRRELEKHNKDLMGKKEFVFLTKTDLVSLETQEAQIEAIKSRNENVRGISAEHFEPVRKILSELSNQKENAAN